MKNAKMLVTLVSTILAGRTAIHRMRQARVDADLMELLDAVLNTAVVVTGVIVVIRRLRRDDEPA